MGVKAFEICFGFFLEGADLGETEVVGGCGIKGVATDMLNGGLVSSMLRLCFSAESYVCLTLGAETKGEGVQEDVVEALESGDREWEGTFVGRCSLLGEIVDVTAELFTVNEGRLDQLERVEEGEAAGR